MAKRRLTGKQIRYLFAIGRLRASGKGKDRKVTYNKNAGKSRSDRVAAGRKIANTPEVARKALKGSGLRVRGSNRPDASTAPLLASGKRMSLKGDTRFLVKTARGAGKLKPRYTPNGSTREARIAAGREKAQAFLSSEKGQRIRSGVEGLRNANRRTGRRDYGKEAKVKAAKDDLRAAGVKIKTGQALAKKGYTPRLSGDFSGRTFIRDAPRYAQQKAATARRTQRAAERESVIAPVRGKSRAERIAAGRSIADNSFRVRIYRDDKQRTAQEQARSNRLRGRSNRVARLEVKRKAESERRLEAAAQRYAVREKRLKGSAKFAARRERAQRINAGRAVLATFRQKRASLYNGSLF